MTMILSILPEDSVLIVGGTGSLGEKLLESLVEQEDLSKIKKIFPFSKERQQKSIRVFSRDEKKQYDLRQKFPSIDFRLGDITDFHSIRSAVRDMNIIIHAAALKYVDISEKQPSMYIDTNVHGTQNLLSAVLLENHAIRCIGISSDKACNPFNVYGLTKQLMEKLFLEVERVKGSKTKTSFNIVRYGNVVGTRGSVLPFWQKCRNAGKPLPLTDPEMTRFIFTLKEAVDLIDFALGCPGGTIVSKMMGTAKLGDLAEIMKTSLAGKMVGVENIGTRGGEKLHEELFSEEEWSHISLNNEPYFILDPNYHKQQFLQRWTSDFAPRIAIEDLKETIKEFLV